MALLPSSAIPSASGGGYTIDQSLRFNDDDSAYLSWTPSSAGNRKTYTWSTWVKRGNLGIDTGVFGCGDVSGGDFDFVRFDTDDKLQFWINNTSYGNFVTTQVFRDPSAFYHIVLAVDTTQSTEADRVKLYVNGSQITDFSTSSYPSEDRESYTSNSGNAFQLGVFSSSSRYLDGYLAEVHFIDGTALTPSSFGETGDYGEWKPKAYDTADAAYGTNGFYLPFNQDYTVEGFSAVTYTGTGADQYIGGTGFQPDLVWLKNRNSTQNHFLMNTVTPNEFIIGNMTDAADTNSGYHITHETDGFGLKSGGVAMNTDNNTYVAWNWDMGGSNASNTDGSITSTVRANPTYGQSIVSYSGTGSAATVGHGLDSSPEMIIVRRRDSGASWVVGHQNAQASDPWDGQLYLDSNGAWSNNSGSFNDTAPTSDVFTINTDNTINNSSGTYIAYCFHSVTGYSSFGSYTGDNTTDGSKEINLGFAPAFLMLKSTSATGGWRMYDVVRSPDGRYILYAHLSQAEDDSANHLDWTSTGFKLTSTDNNASGVDYIYMAFADKREAAFWLDQSGNNNDWTSNNLTESDVSVDSPTNNFATLNSTIRRYTGGGADSEKLSEGNLKLHALASNGVSASAWGSIPLTSGGKWYWEVVTQTATSNRWVGVGDDLSKAGLGSYAATARSYGVFYKSSGDKSIDETESSYGNSYTAGDIIGVALDMDNNNIYFSKNGTWQNSGVPTSGATGTGKANTAALENSVIPALMADPNGTLVVANFGQDSSFAGNKTAQGNQDSNSIGDFYYEPPTGFLALCSSNLPDVDIVPSEHFNTVTYAGNGSGSGQAIAVGFKPDLTWLKIRNGSNNHALQDSVRGTSKTLFTDVNNGESEYGTDLFSSFDTNGFTLGTGSYGLSNDSGSTYVSWNWKANGSGSSNTDGSITSTVSANQDAGFSIVSYTGNGSDGATIGHGLSKAPELVIFKDRDASVNWAVMGYPTHPAYSTDGNMLFLNETEAQGNSESNEMSLGASTMTLVDSGPLLGTSGNDYIAYCFHSVEGFSKTGTYEGNDDADGTFIYTGFRPAWVLFRRTDSTSSWTILDNARTPINPIDDHMRAQTSDPEMTSDPASIADFTSNGFKLRTSYSETNAQSGKYIYMAFAENPFVTSTGIPTTAR